VRDFLVRQDADRKARHGWLLAQIQAKERIACSTRVLNAHGGAWMPIGVCAREGNLRRL